jgi:hypothetical protein
VIEYRGALAEPDVVAAARLRRRVIAEGGSARDGLLWMGIGFAALAVWGYFSVPQRSPQSLWWLPFSLLCLSVWWRRRDKSLQRWRKYAALSGEHSGTVTDNALEARLLGVDARLPWALFSSQLASRDVVVLFVGTHLQLVLAAGQFAGEDAWRRAYEIVARHVREPKRSSLLIRTVLWTLLLLALFLAWHLAQIKR